VNRSCIALATGVALLGATPAFAQEDLPKGLMQTKAASSGSENVTSAGFEAPVATASDEDKDTTELKINAGGLASGGNSKSLAMTASSKLRVRRGMNQLSAAAAANYGKAAPKGESDMRTTVENYQARIREDRFLADHFAVFVAMSGLRDRFLGLRFRLNFDPGFAYYLLDEAKHRLWLEAGYDLQHDFRRGDALRAAFAKGVALERSEVRHSGRLFLGYENSLTENITVDTGLEYLQAFKDTENYRINWDLGINSRIGGNFSLATTLNLRYDHNPLPGIKTTDVTSALSLVYQLL
jgi:putative salt-induced outer membrane protein YdiY